MVNKHYVLPSILFKRKDMIKDTIIAILLALIIIVLYIKANEYPLVAGVLGFISIFILAFLVTRKIVKSSK